jgi:hypothetical protein
MQYAFQDRENLYLVIDIMQGGDLRYHFAKHRKFTEEQTSIIIYEFKLIYQNSLLHACLLVWNISMVKVSFIEILNLKIWSLMI